MVRQETMSGRDQNRQVECDLGDGLIQRGARFGLAAATAIRAARAGLQFGECLHAVSSGATDVVIGNGVAEAYVHVAYCQRECE
jgi:hypothetical protein